MPEREPPAVATFRPALVTASAGAGWPWIGVGRGCCKCRGIARASDNECIRDGSGSPHLRCATQRV
jgi:hypothetical protein